MFHVESRLDLDRPIGLRSAALHPARHVGRGVADIDLAAGNVVLSSVERGRLGEAGHRVFGRGIRCRVGSRHAGRDGGIIDDPTSHGCLTLHHLERLLRTQEHSGQVDVHDGRPLLVSQFLEESPSAEPRVVEQHVEPAERLLRLGEQRSDGVGVGHVCLNDQDT